MNSDIDMPNVITEIRIGNFTLYAYAYRTLKRNECLLAKAMWLKQHNKKSIPKSGSGKIITIFGHNLE